MFKSCLRYSARSIVRITFAKIKYGFCFHFASSFSTKEVCFEDFGNTFSLLQKLFVVRIYDSRLYISGEVWKGFDLVFFNFLF